MNGKRHVLETLTLVSAAVVCALVANALAGRERRLAMPGAYSAPVAGRTPTISAPVTTSTAEPVAEPSAVPTAIAAARPSAAASPQPALPTPARKTPSPATAATPPATAAADLTKRFPPHPDKPWVEVSGDDVAWLHARGALVLDARRTKVYEEGHIAGARSFPIWESDIDERVTALVNEGRDGSQPVVIYCSGGDCEDSHMLSQKLFGGGFNNLVVYHDGWPDWQTRKGPGRTGPQP